jgi:hypothetical protein
MTRLRPLLGHMRWGGLGHGGPAPEKIEKRIVGRLRIWPVRLRKIRNFLSFKSFYNFQTNLNSIKI